MKSQSSFSAWLFFAIIFFSSLIMGCRKDSSTESTIATSSISRLITLEEVIAKYGSLGTGQRTDDRLPLNVIPDWNDAYTYNKADIPFILTTVDASTLYQDNWYGGNLAFYKDSLGIIRSVLLVWRADSLTPYLSNEAPLDSTSQFTGMMMLISSQDSVKKIARLSSGGITKAKGGSVSVCEFSLENLGGSQDRGPETGCYDFGKTWWDRIWGGIKGALEWLGNVFEGQTWDDMTGQNIYYGAGSFFFGGGYGIDVNGYTPPGGSGAFEQEFSNQMGTCATIREYLQSVGEIPPSYSQLEIHFCQLIDEVGLDGDQSRCLYRYLSTSYIEELWNYWNASDKSGATSNKLKAYINAKCTAEFPALLVDLVKDQFCLEQSPIDLMENIKNECNLSSYNSQEWESSLNNGLSECVKNVIIEDRFNHIRNKFGLSITMDDFKENIPENCLLTPGCDNFLNCFEEEVNAGFVGLCVNENDLVKLSDPDVSAYYVKYLNLQVGFLHTSTGANVIVTFPELCIQTHDGYSKAKTAKLIKTAFELAVWNTEAAMNRGEVPPLSASIQSYLMSSFVGILNLEMGGGCTVTGTGGCRGDIAGLPGQVGC